MKITHTDNLPQTPEAFYKFELVGSVLKTHFKTLMRLSDGYKWDSKTGTISSANAYDFLDLVAKIEKSNSKRCKTSHNKSIAKKKTPVSSSASSRSSCTHDDLGSLGYTHGSRVSCPGCGKIVEVW